MRCLPDSHYIGPYFCPVSLLFLCPLQPWPLLMPPWRQYTRSSFDCTCSGDYRLAGDQGSLPPPHYDENNHHFNHTTPDTTPYYHPSAIREQLHITEYQTTQTPLLHNNTHYVELFTAFTLEEYQLLSLQQSTPLGQLDFTRPLRCIPGDLRMPRFLPTSLPQQPGTTT